MTASMPATLPVLADKRVKVLAVTGEARIPQSQTFQAAGTRRQRRQCHQLLGHRRAGGHVRAIVAKLNARRKSF